MIAYEVYLNGEKLCTAGGAELTALTGTLTFFPNRPDELGPLLTVGGVVCNPEEFLHWAHRGLRVGNRVEIRIVESSKADEPISRDHPGHASCSAEPHAG